MSSQILKNAIESRSFDKKTALLHGMEVGQFYGSLVKSRIGKRYRRIHDEILDEILFSKIHYLLQERPFPRKSMSSIDKIFSSFWMDQDLIVTGGKDNKLLIWDISEDVISPKIVQLPEGNSPMPTENCGIHSISASPKFNFLATGALNPSEVAIFSIPDMKPKAVLRGHTDWTFDSCWLSEYDVVSISRDKSICIWNISSVATNYSNSMPVLSPTISIKAHNRKVRKIKTNELRSRLSTLSADCTMKVWDPQNLQCLSTAILTDAQELVCLEWNFLSNCILIGSHNGIQIFDPTSNKLILNIDTMNGDWGVRSLSSKQNLVTIGTGIGKLYFYDLRKMNFEKDKSQEIGPLVCQATGTFLREDMFYERYFAGVDIPHAIYTHQYDPTGTRLFTAGGPLLFGLSGSYAAIW